MDSACDIALLREFRDCGSDAAFAALVTRYSDLVYATALRRTRNADLATDVCQSVFVVFARKAPKMSDSGSIGGWLHRATVLEAARLKRTEARRIKRMENYRENLGSSMGRQETFDPELLDAIDDGLLRLPDRDRLLLSWRFFDGLPFAEIAERLGKSENACHKLQSRALDKMRKTLRNSGFAVSANAISNTMGGMASTSICSRTLVSSVLRAVETAPPTSNLGASTMQILMKISKPKMLGIALIAFLSTGICLKLWRDSRTIESIKWARQLNHLQVLVRDERLKRSAGDDIRIDGMAIEQLIAKAQEAFESEDMATLGDVVSQIGRLSSPSLHLLLGEVDQAPLHEELRLLFAGFILQAISEDEPAFAIAAALDYGMTSQAKEFIARWAKRDAEAAIEWYNEMDHAQQETELNALLQGIVSSVAESDPKWAIELIDHLGDQEVDSVMKGLGGALAKTGLDSDRSKFVEIATRLENEEKRVAALRHFGIVTASHEGFEEATSYLQTLKSELDTAEWNSVMIDSVGIDIHDRTSDRLDWIAANSSEAHLPDNVARVVAQLTMGTKARIDVVEEWMKSLGDSPVRDKGIDVLAMGLTSRHPAKAFMWAQAIKDGSLRDERMRQVYHTWNAVDSGAARAELTRLGITTDDFGYTGRLVKFFE